MDVTWEARCLCSVQHIPQFFEKLCRIKQRQHMKASQKSLAGAFVRKTETPTQKILSYLKMPKLEEILTAVVIVCHHY